MTQPEKIDDARARLLMSQLIDGELSPDDAAALESYLRANPDAADWMENLDTLRKLQRSDALAPEREAALAQISAGVRGEAATRPKAKKLLRFRSYLAPLAAAAALAMAGGLAWVDLRKENSVSPRHPEPAIVEFVTTDIPDASTFIYSDEESGWTVVWVESGSGGDHG